MKIVIMGTGGTGGYYGALLAKQGHDVSFVARGAHLQAIQKNGLQVKSIFGDFQIKPAKATDDPSKIAPPDLILFCTKTYDTAEAVQTIKPIVAGETTVLSLQNGIDAVERIGKVVGMEHMIAGATWLSSAVAAPGVIKHVSDFRRVVLGELDGRLTPRVQAICQAFKDTGITVEPSDNILRILWTKFVFISAASSFGALTRLPMGEYRSVPETRALIVRLMHEVEALALASGVALEADVVDKSLAFMDNAAPHIKASMQLDVEAGHPSEIESIVGVIGRKGRERGLPTPVADAIYAMLLPVELKAQSGQLHS
ncbi:MAG TPA: 2-dehydropantoate 2-reductase [Anaerolineales bacterium]|nr:2-dehydropantoate 2-reductase [Anaerolineales bacterium]